jgi:hypothetical protein
VSNLTTEVIRFRLEGERKQQSYADGRYAWTEYYRREFNLWQREVERTRARLVALLRARSRSGQHSAPPQPPSSAP